MPLDAIKHCITKRIELEYLFVSLFTMKYKSFVLLTCFSHKRLFPLAIRHLTLYQPDLPYQHVIGPKIFNVNCFSLRCIVYNSIISVHSSSTIMSALSCLFQCCEHTLTIRYYTTQQSVNNIRLSDSFSSKYGRVNIFIRVHFFANHYNCVQNKLKMNTVLRFVAEPDYCCGVD